MHGKGYVPAADGSLPSTPGFLGRGESNGLSLARSAVHARASALTAWAASRYRVGVSDTLRAKAEAWDRVVAEAEKPHNTSTALGITVRRIIEDVNTPDTRTPPSTGSESP